MNTISYPAWGLLISIVLSFSNQQGFQGGCQANIYWFIVSGSPTEMLTVAIGQIVPVLDANNDNVKDEIPFRNQSGVIINEFSFCQFFGQYYCAMGYSTDQIERVEIPLGSNNYYFRPIMSPIQIPKCVVKKTI